MTMKATILTRVLTPTGTPDVLCRRDTLTRRALRSARHARCKESAQRARRARTAHPWPTSFNGSAVVQHARLLPRACGCTLREQQHRDVECRCPRAAQRRLRKRRAGWRPGCNPLRCTRSAARTHVKCVRENSASPAPPVTALASEAGALLCAGFKCRTKNVRHGSPLRPSRGTEGRALQHNAALCKMAARPSAASMRPLRTTQALC